MNGEHIIKLYTYLDKSMKIHKTQFFDKIKEVLKQVLFWDDGFLFERGDGLGMMDWGENSSCWILV